MLVPRGRDPFVQRRGSQPRPQGFSLKKWVGRGWRGSLLKNPKKKHLLLADKIVFIACKFLCWARWFHWRQVICVHTNLIRLLYDLTGAPNDGFCEMHWKQRQCILGGRAVTIVAFLEKYCSWVEEICKRRSTNARGFPGSPPPPPPPRDESFCQEPGTQRP